MNTLLKKSTLLFGFLLVSSIAFAQFADSAEPVLYDYTETDGIKTHDGSIHALADDVIVFRNGDIINCTVIEITSDVIKYKKSSNPEGPIYSTNRNEVLFIKYANGEMDKFELPQETSKSNVSDGNRTTEKAIIAEDNTSELLRYSSLPRLVLNPQNKESKDFFPIMSFTDASVISTRELTLIVDPQAIEYYDGGWKVKIGYAFCIVNKTDKPLYIDRANCFRRFNDLETKSYFDNATTLVSHGNSIGGGVSLSNSPIGIAVGSSSNSSYSETYGLDRILVIGPYSKANLVDYEYVRLSETKAKFKTINDIERWGFNLYLSSNEPVKQGEVKIYTEEDTPYSNKYFITYSTDPDFNKTYTFEFELYAKYLVGAKIKQEKWSMLLPEARIIEEYKKIIPDFWTDSLAIIGIMGHYIK